MILSAREVCFSVGSDDLLKGISAEFSAGEVHVIVGPNGAGKSTLLKTLSGELSATRGEVLCKGIPFTDWRVEELSRFLAVLPQQSTLSFPFTAHEVVELGRIPHATGRVRDSEIVGDAMALMDVSAFAHRDYTTLSGGEKQRVQIARVLAQIWEHSAECILLMDEPTSSLDLAHQRNVLRIARQQAARNVCVVVVLHDINLAAEFSDRIFLMREGRIYARGAPDEVLNSENLNAVFEVETLVVPHPSKDIPLVLVN